MNAMHMGWEGDGSVSERIIDFYRERSLGGVGLIIAGGFKIDKVAAEKNFLSLEDDSCLPGLKALTAESKKTGTRI